MAGYAEHSHYDYKGNLLASVRQLAADYHQAVDWTPLAGLTVGRPARRRRDRGRPAATRRRRPGRLHRQHVLRRAEPADPGWSPRTTRRCGPTCCGPATTRPRCSHRRCLAAAGRGAGRAARPGHRRPARGHGIGYNARGQRVSVGFGNGTSTAYDYDPQTFRLASLTTTRPASFARRPADRPGPRLLLRPGRQRHPDPRRRGHPERDLLQQPAGRARRPTTPTTRCTG